MTRPELSWILLALGVFLLAAPAGAQSSVKVEAKVFSRRAQRAHLELKSAFKSHEARLAPNQTIKLQLGEGEPIQAKLLAVSSRYLVVELPAEVELPEGALWVVGQTKPPPEGALPGEAPAGSDVRVGRRAPSLSTFRAEPPPEHVLQAQDFTLVHLDAALNLRQIFAKGDLVDQLLHLMKGAIALQLFGPLLHLA